jgi:hypothetical protein
MASVALVTAAMAGGCAQGTQAAAAGDVIDPADASRTVVLQVNNINQQSMELRTILNGQSNFIGSVGGADSTSILLDPTMFPAGMLYIEAVPASGMGRAVVGPLSANRGQRIKFTIQPALGMSSAIVTR